MITEQAICYVWRKKRNKMKKKYSSILQRNTGNSDPSANTLTFVCRAIHVLAALGFCISPGLHSLWWGSYDSLSCWSGVVVLVLPLYSRQERSQIVLWSLTEAQVQGDTIPCPTVLTGISLPHPVSQTLRSVLQCSKEGFPRGLS